MTHNVDNAGTTLDRQLAYAILRLTLGINILVHGLVRLPQLALFADGIVQAFAKTPLPPQVVDLFAFALPFAETFVGLLLILGLWTRLALVSGGLLIIALVFGTALRSDWDTLGMQMIYAAIYYLLLVGSTYNRFSLDNCAEEAAQIKRSKEKNWPNECAIGRKENDPVLHFTTTNRMDSNENGRLSNDQST
jgi:thiosulfate dehydrogenase [quinone] large subunit